MLRKNNLNFYLFLHVTCSIDVSCDKYKIDFIECNILFVGMKYHDNSNWVIILFEGSIISLYSTDKYHYVTN